MKITLVDRIDMKHGEEMEAYELKGGVYDARFINPYSRRFYFNYTKSQIVELAQNLEPTEGFSTLFVSQIKEINYEPEDRATA